MAKLKPLARAVTAELFISFNCRIMFVLEFLKLFLSVYSQLNLHFLQVCDSSGIQFVETMVVASQQKIEIAERFFFFDA